MFRFGNKQTNSIVDQVTDVIGKGFPKIKYGNIVQRQHAGQTRRVARTARPIVSGANFPAFRPNKPKS